MAKVVIPSVHSISTNCCGSCDKESIDCAVYVDPETGKRSEGSTHFEANPDAPKDESERNTDAYMFKTSKGRDVGRIEAYHIAKHAKQLKSGVKSKRLFSSMLKKNR